MTQRIVYTSRGHNLRNFRRAMGIERKARKRVIAGYCKLEQRSDRWSGPAKKRKLWQC